MVENKVSIKTNWNLISERNLKDTISIKYCTNDELQLGRVELDELVGEDRAALLESETSICELNFEMAPTYNLHGFIVISECPKIELFVGAHQEYVKTYFGDILDDFEGTRVFRFDVQISQQNIADMTIKLVPGIKQFWIYGMMLFLKTHSTTSMFAPKINLENVQNILSNSNQKLSPNAEKCKQFLQTYMSNKNNEAPPNIASLISVLNSNIERNLTVNVNQLTESGNNFPKTSRTQDISEPEQYLESKLKQMESNINMRLTEIEREQCEKLEQMMCSLDERIQQRLKKLEESQNIKLDKIINMLQNKLDI